MLKSSFRRLLFVLNSPLATLWKDLELFKVLILKRKKVFTDILACWKTKDSVAEGKKVKTTTKDPQESELEPWTPRSRILSLSLVLRHKKKPQRNWRSVCPTFLVVFRRQFVTDKSEAPSKRSAKIDWRLRVNPVRPLIDVCSCVISIVCFSLDAVT